MMRGFALLPTLSLLLVLAHHGEGRSVPHMSDQTASPKPVPCRRGCNPKNRYHCDCIPMPILIQAEATTDSSASAPAVRAGNRVDVTAPEMNKSMELARAQTDGASVPCRWVCDAENNYGRCECIPVYPAAGAAQSNHDFRREATPASTARSSSTAAAAAAATADVPANGVQGGELTRIFGIPGTVLGRTLLQERPGWSPRVITTLDAKTSVQVLCKRADAPVKDDPWWLRVHVWATGEEGWVADFWVLCRHSSGNCRVPFCVD